jgi:hypothetical protein
VDICIVQPIFAPWRGFFHMVSSCDVYVSLESVQYTSRDWRNRNQIISQRGPMWVTIPVARESHQRRSLAETRISSEGKDWKYQHLETMTHSYGKAPFFNEGFGLLKKAYSRGTDLLTDFTFEFLRDLSEYLNISTLHRRHKADGGHPSPTGRLVEICREFGASRYISGPSATADLDLELFDKADIEVVFLEYPTYPHYKQLWVDGFREVSIIDVIMNNGPASRNLIGAVNC